MALLVLGLNLQARQHVLMSVLRWNGDILLLREGPLKSDGLLHVRYTRWRICFLMSFSGLTLDSVYVSSCCTLRRCSCMTLILSLFSSSAWSTRSSCFSSRCSVMSLVRFRRCRCSPLERDQASTYLDECIQRLVFFVCEWRQEWIVFLLYRFFLCRFHSNGACHKQLWAAGRQTASSELP